MILINTFYTIFFTYIFYITYLFNKKLNFKFLGIFSLLSLLALFIILILNFDFFLLKQGELNFNVTLINNFTKNLSLKLEFKLNFFSFFFILLVVSISIPTIIYSLNYLKFEERTNEFLLFLNFFIISIIFLFLSNNLFTLILGWELIGLSSYFLINFWKFKKLTLISAFKAFSFNKVSDIFLIFGCSLLWSTYHVDNISTMTALISTQEFNTDIILIVCWCFFISACIKSAQIIGHLWLIDSMEAPVPASALIHSATLVSAGIYLLLKFHIFFVLIDFTPIYLFIGSITACYGGLSACAQTDVKKLLAYSTISHCGFLITSLALDNFIITTCYLYLHGLFKAASFLAISPVIKNFNTQDMRYMGAYKKSLLNVVCLSISVFNLCGLPFGLGSLYKELFLHLIVTSNLSQITVGLLFLGMVSSIIYGYRLIYYTCFDFFKGSNTQVDLLLQNNTKINIQYFRNFSYATVFSFLFLFTCSLFFYIIFKYFCLNYIYYLENNSYIFFLKYKFTKKMFINSYILNTIYATSCIIICASMALYSSRTHYFTVEQLNLYLCVFGFFLFAYIFNKINNDYILYYIGFICNF